MGCAQVDITMGGCTTLLQHSLEGRNKHNCNHLCMVVDEDITISPTSGTKYKS